ncbi:MAG: YHS domain-containing protein [Deltaproteobacteria bacterium]|nr:YHS domain-containing protein [Deltaproteobacteria bacterium]MBW1925277.1 YHS domain-containing protein [Deltaproteobacteria bacterium]MBW1950800.1 YHS domain-containing protein [Deltaproteobacteria bacterium]MBW2008982.1 YHS domain-containing protein [Deltaproteobacteria bacterium]MBW2102853.1 YHS domain-containing protein [Deltaproteobacteria bacterium]
MGIIRLLILGGLIYLLYRLGKGVFGSGGVAGGRKDGIIDEMVQDPQCRTYIPRREAVRKVIRGREFYFCSEECAAAYKRKSGE